MVRRSGDVDLSASRGLTTNSVMIKSLTGTKLTPMVVFIVVVSTSRPPFAMTSCPTSLAHHTSNLSLNLSRPILVHRPNSEHGRKAAQETMRSSTATTTRKRVFGGAWRPSSQVRHSSLTHRLPLHAADLVLSARVEGPFLRLLSSQPTINGALVAYGSRCTRWYAARWRAGSQ